MTRGELRARLCRALSESPTAPTYWSVWELNQLLDEAQEWVAEGGTQLTETFHVPRRAGCFVYSLAGCGERIMAPLRIWLPDQSRRLDAWSLTDLDARHEQWMTVQGTPWVWAPIDWQTFVIWPGPSTGGGWLEVTAAVWPAPMDDDSEAPAMLEADQETMMWYAQMMGYLKQQEPQRATELAQRLLPAMDKATARGGTGSRQGAFRAREKDTGRGATDSWTP